MNHNATKSRQGAGVKVKRKVRLAGCPRIIARLFSRNTSTYACEDYVVAQTEVRAKPNEPNQRDAISKVGPVQKRLDGHLARQDFPSILLLEGTALTQVVHAAYDFDVNGAKGASIAADRQPIGEDDDQDAPPPAQSTSAHAATTQSFQAMTHASKMAFSPWV